MNTWHCKKCDQRIDYDQQIPIEIHYPVGMQIVSEEVCEGCYADIQYETGKAPKTEMNGGYDPRKE